MTPPGFPPRVGKTSERQVPMSTDKMHPCLNPYSFFFFNAYWYFKSTFSESWRGRCILDWRIVQLVRYIGSCGIPPFSPPIEISSISPKRKIHWIIKNWKREIKKIILIVPNSGWTSDHPLVPSMHIARSERFDTRNFIPIPKETIFNRRICNS